MKAHLGAARLSTPLCSPARLLCGTMVLHAMAFVNPRTVLEEAGVAAGDKVADFGAGTGFYSAAAAELVGEDGKVYAIDIQPELITKPRSLAPHCAGRIECIRADVEIPGDTHLAAGLVDWVILSNILFQLEDKAAALREAHRVLRPGGKLLVVDWADSYGGLGPPPERVVSADEGKRLAEAAGFRVEGPLKDAGDHHWGFVCVK